MKFRVTFVYVEEFHVEIFEGEDADEVIYEVESMYESNAFYDNHYISDLEIEEITDE